MSGGIRQYRLNLTDLIIDYRYMNAEKYNLDRIYFGGCFIRGIAQLFDWLNENSSSWGRACCNYRDTIICHSVLEQGHKASAVPPP